MFFMGHSVIYSQLCYWYWCSVRW